MRLTRAARLARLRESRLYAQRLIDRTNARRLELLQSQGLHPVLADGTCAICLGGGRIIRSDSRWKRCPCSN